jgi:CheY-like chemotaxis protein
MSEQNRALVVDDSKSARLVLGRMLENYDLSVDTVDSADGALEYLIHNRPDVIFMDHMMPGMDGFEAVKAIKGNPDTATIPVMMYTSKGGDLYLGQARALGAVGVLPKTVAPAELFETLQRLGLVKDRRSEERTPEERDEEFEAIDEVVRSPIRPAPFMEPGMRRSSDALDAEQLDSHMRYLLDEQRVEIRKDLLLSMEAVSRQTGNRIHRELDEKLEPLLQQEPPRQVPFAIPTVVLSLLLLASLVWNFMLQNQTEQPEATINAAQAADQEQAEQTIAQLEVLQMETVGLLNQAWQMVGWAANQELQYSYDEIALDNQRIDIIEQLLEQLNVNGFRGKVVLETHVGEFCLLGNNDDGFRLPAPDLTVDQCEFIGNPVQAVDSPSAHQSLRFAAFASTTTLLDEDTLTLEVFAASRSDPMHPYPARSKETSAQAWNQAATRNNRVIIYLEPE